MTKINLDILKKQGPGFKVPKGYFDTVEDYTFSEFSVKDFPKETGYILPEKYFETVDDRIFTKVNSIKSNKNQADVPKNYFNSIEDIVFEKIAKEKEPKVIQLKSRLITVLASLAVAASLLLLFKLNTIETEDSINFDNVSEFEVWIEDGSISLDSYQISEVYNDVNFEDEFDTEDIELIDYINGTDIESVLLTD